MEYRVWVKILSFKFTQVPCEGNDMQAPCLPVGISIFLYQSVQPFAHYLVTLSSKNIDFQIHPSTLPAGWNIEFWYQFVQPFDSHQTFSAGTNATQPRLLTTVLQCAIVASHGFFVGARVLLYIHVSL